jgi:hypothetical protein
MLPLKKFKIELYNLQTCHYYEGLRLSCVVTSLLTARDIMHKPYTYARCISKPEPSDAPDTCYNHGLLEKINPSLQIQLHV